jgi:hypothetical protein
VDWQGGMDTSQEKPDLDFVMKTNALRFDRKPAKMGEDFIFWIPRVYIKNELIDPACEYHVYLVKKAK